MNSDKKKNGNKIYLREDFQYGMHACGFIYDLMFTNSLESLTYWYSKGIRLFEIDIDLAEDGEFVACHNFSRETLVKMEIDHIPVKCTSDWFRQQKLYFQTTGGLTPMTLEDVFVKLQKYTDMLIMIDPKVYSFEETCNLLEKIEQRTKVYNIDNNRLIFELYNQDMIKATAWYPSIVQFQYCVDDEMQMGTSQEIRDWDIDRLIDYLKMNDIWILSYPWKLAVEKLPVLKKLYDAGFIIFSKTRNDILSELLHQAGVKVNIIDYLVTQRQREELQNYKDNYYKRYKAKIDEVFGNAN